MTEKEDRRAEALRANLKRRKTWQRGQKNTMQGDGMGTKPKPGAGLANSSDKHKGS